MDSIFKRLQNICEADGDVTLRDSYSGRGMYNSTCIGIVGNKSDCMSVIAHVVSELTSELFETAVNAVGDTETDAVYEQRDTVMEMQRTLLDFSTDSMGCDTIVYWPRLTADAVEEEEDDQLT